MADSVALAPSQRLRLKPCPFCGQWNDLEMVTCAMLGWDEPVPMFLVLCDGSEDEKRETFKIGCGAIGPAGGTIEQAIEEWNMRPGEDT